MAGTAFTNSGNEDSGVETLVPGSGPFTQTPRARPTNEELTLGWKDQAITFFKHRRSEAESLIRKYPLAALLTGVSLGGLIALKRQR